MWRLLANIKNAVFLVVFTLLVVILLASAWTHHKGLNAVLVHAHQALQDRGEEGKIFIKLKGISFKNGLHYRYIAKRGKNPILVAMYNVVSGEVTTFDVDAAVPASDSSNKSE